ncbi:hypothetical protein [Domibacillus aminovorans]|uniref:hypothetical protein n=1 Tax=Domibacillus aminovorans TaxID=29332 RepID=UPI0012FE0622|nr:hypothetical protein [Domibacillus aminovorans]
MKAYVLKEKTGRYRCHNVYVKDESYHRNIVNASMKGHLDRLKKLGMLRGKKENRGC